MTDTIPLRYIQDRLVDLISSGQGTVRTSSPLEMDDWPIAISDLITEETVAREGNVITVIAEDATTVDGFTLRRRNATGGDYADVEQFISLNAALTLTEDDAGHLIIPRDGFGDLEFVCEISLSNGESYSGESPPF